MREQALRSASLLSIGANSWNHVIQKIFSPAIDGFLYDDEKAKIITIMYFTVRLQNEYGWNMFTWKTLFVICEAIFIVVENI